MATMSGNDSATKKCSWCSKSKPIDQFREREFATGTKRISTCIPCEPKKSAKRKAWVKSAKGQQWLKRTNQMDSVAESKALHKKSELCLKTAREYDGGDGGKACRERKRAKYQSESDYRLMLRISSKMSGMATSRRKSSTNVTDWSGFRNAEEVRQHLRESNPSVDIDGDNWHIDHTIARVWYMYAFNGVDMVRTQVGDDDMRKCWNRENLQAMIAKENMSKSYKLPDDATLNNLRHLWPSHWNGELPSADYRAAMHVQVKCGGSSGRRFE